MLRQKKFYIFLYIFLFLSILALVMLLFMNDGLKVDTKYAPSGGKNYLELTISNTSNHLIEHIDVINNSTKVYSIDKLNPKEKQIYDLELNSLKNEIIVKADNHISFEKTVSGTNQSNNATQGNFNYNLKYDTFVLNIINNVDLQICNYGDATVLDVALVDNNFISIEKGNAQIILPKGGCESAKFTLKPISSGETTLTFKIYNGSYYKELNSKIEIIK